MEFRGFALAVLVLAALILLSGSHVAAAGSGSNSTVVAVNLSSELNNSLAQGFNFTAGDFQSTSTAACVRALITGCDNNNPSQFVCLNSSAYNNAYLPQEQNNTSNKAHACPEYMLAGVVGCASVNDYCVVTHQQYSLSSGNTTTVNATTIYHTTSSQPTTSVPVNVPVVGTSSVNSLINEIIQFFQSIFNHL